MLWRCVSASDRTFVRGRLKSWSRACRSVLVQGGRPCAGMCYCRRKACLGYSYYPVSFGFGVKVLLIMGMGCSTIMSAQFAFTNKDFRLALS
jgi:hypothetical protein